MINAVRYTGEVAAGHCARVKAYIWSAWTFKAAPKRHSFYTVDNTPYRPIKRQLAYRAEQNSRQSLGLKLFLLSCVRERIMFDVCFRLRSVNRF